MTPLVDRMRTCAAAINAGSGFPEMVAVDAARLLIEAAEIIAKSEIDLLDVQTAAPTHTTRHFDDGSKHCLTANRLRGNDRQAMQSIGRQR